ncbi:hypothetical protein [Kutzneria sp. 744]|uniref:hypothetical protein n=1 Tax=Kutzneria sp. (strain 744) TaxID=345341 RepID=UPI0003EEB88A|nr:hypothetical protein [Kutzneria sp. 744]EWM13452.1 hypothetical protein KUTG_03756 [Kutzneria sp. 744]
MPDLPLISGPEFPIGLYWPPPPEFTTLARYQEIAAAGFTFLITGNYLGDGTIIGSALQQADAVGLKVLVFEDTQLLNLTRWFTLGDDRSAPMSISMSDGAELIRRVEAAYGPHPSLAGYNLFDEPDYNKFDTVGRAFQLVRQNAPARLPYCNLLPDLGRAPGDYPNYLERFCQVVQPSLLSFDRYPMTSASGSFDVDYFTNWVDFREVGLRHNLPTWTYIQAVGTNWYRVPTTAEMLFLINVSLAYGCKGIQYFTYWQPDPARGEDFQPALMDLNGNQTARYQGARTINTTWLRQVGRELKPLVSERVMHFEEPADPARITEFSPDAFVSTVAGDPVILGQFTSGAPGRWLLVVNRSFSAASTTSLWFGPAVSSVTLFDPGSQTYRPVRDPSTVTVMLPAGGAALYRLQ